MIEGWVKRGIRRSILMEVDHKDLLEARIDEIIPQVRG